MRLTEVASKYFKSFTAIHCGGFVSFQVSHCHLFGLLQKVPGVTVTLI